MNQSYCYSFRFCCDPGFNDRREIASLRRFVLGDQGGDGVHATDPSGTRISAQTPRLSAAGDSTKAARAP